MVTPHTSTGSGAGSWTSDFTGDALVFMWAGGGGGGGGQGLSRGGSGGGGGAFVIFTVPVTNGATYNYNVGVGGTGGNYGGGAGTAGGNTTWASHGGKLAEGGKGGAAAPGAGGGPASVADSVSTGGAGMPYDVWNGGAGGKGGGTLGGNGGPSNGQGIGQAGTAPGGGGSGGGQSTNASGGAGGIGRVYIQRAPIIEPGKYIIGYNSVTGLPEDPNLSPGYTWTAPADGQVVVQVVGSGGGGRGGGGSLGIQGGSGGGGGGYSSKVVTVTKGTQYALIVPPGGNGSPYNSSTTTDGQAAIFKLRNSPGTELVKANGGLRATGTLTGAGAGASTTGAIGDTVTTGDSGANSTGSSTNGGNGGGGGLPIGGAGGLGSGQGTNTGTSGLDGTAPGGGGGGGKGAFNGNGGNGARGGVFIAYYLTLGSVIVDNEEKYIVRLRYKDTSGAGPTDGAVHTITESWVVVDEQKISTLRVRPNLNVATRPKPTYIPAGYEDRFDVATGCFNWRAVKNSQPAIAANNYQYAFLGDSVGEGWNYLNPLPPYNSSADFPHAWPRECRQAIVDQLGKNTGGTGFIRGASIGSEGGDTSWNRGQWGSGGVHFISTNTNGHVAIFTGEKPGTAVRVTTSGGAVNVKIKTIIDGVSGAEVDYGNTTVTAIGGLTAKTITGLPLGIQVVRLTSVSVPTGIMGADVYTPGIGIVVHNVAQGGATASYGSKETPAQSVWEDYYPGVPNSMLALYSNQVECFGRRQDAVMIMLGGNDSFQSVPPQDIADAHGVIGGFFDHANTDIIIMPDVHTEEAVQDLMQLCIDNDWGMVDFFWLSRNLATIFGQKYNGDDFGHLNVRGAQWVGGLAANALINGPQYPPGYLYPDEL